MNSDLLDLNELIKEDTSKVVCKGLIYRCHVHTFINAKGHVIFKTEYVPMKKLSCSDCESCEYLLDNLRETINNNTIIIHEPKEGQLYRLSIINERRDWETGYIDDWDTAFVPVPENKE